MDYSTADSKLQGRNNLRRKVGNNTYLVRNSGVPGDSIHLKLHNTYVITWYADGRVELNTGGWRTVTTKDRINNNLEGFGIAQRKGQWYFLRNTDTAPYWEDVAMFEDGMVINADGEVTGASPLETASKPA